MFSVLPTFLFINNRLQTAVCKQYITDLNSLLFWNQNFLWHCLWVHPFSIEITIIDMKPSHSLCISKKSWSVFVKKPNYNSEWVIVNSNIKSHKLETPSLYHTCFCYTHWYLRGVKNIHDNSLHSMKIWVISITLTESLFSFLFYYWLMQVDIQPYDYDYLGNKGVSCKNSHCPIKQNRQLFRALYCDSFGCCGKWKENLVPESTEKVVNLVTFEQQSCNKQKYQYHTEFVVWNSS